MNGSDGKFEKARIEALEGALKGQPIECTFNPEEFTIDKRNTWSRPPNKGKEVPPLEFGGGNASSLKMELFFDTYEKGSDVRDITNKIWQLMAVDESLTDRTTKKGRPPQCQFVWGQMKSFKAVLTSISQKFTMFTSGGKPVRATVNVTFEEAEKPGKYPLQNPTSGGSPGYKTRVVKEGDALELIAHEEYGDAALWRYIADINNIDNPKALNPGQILSIAPLP